ncbi:flagellar biosynthesis anti-sigma factor FlgM [Paenibacillus sp.]|uniref:flagellar biosynthesis anti-sigma factor FlgM n=1 Tax=Paenibacillus sp. TaxID=58172 RepID=UPI002D476C76|nr:flagellar biosynthesis anti-sigma factor FlgM [Paenibacillus sp.]HZG56548.1 flagellar biosynthesis anti-sigma factor FlgM [Paenibacillus sp.]
MKINESGRLSSIQAYRAGLQAKDAKAAAGKGAQKDNVVISAEAMEMLEAQRIGGSERAERLEALKHSVQTGSYHVSTERLAEKLLPYLK